MFRKKFQGGSYFEVFNVLEKNPTENWKLSSSSIKKIYDKHAKGFVLCLSGNEITTWMQLPSDLKRGLGLLQSLLVFQLILSEHKDVSLEISISLECGGRKRIIISTLRKKVHITPLLAQIPFIWKRNNVWFHLCLDLDDLVSGLWNGQIFNSIERITLRASCRLKRIFTLNKSHFNLSSDNDLQKEQLLCCFPSQFLIHGVYDVCIVNTTHVKQVNLSRISANLPLHKKHTGVESTEEKDGNLKQNMLMDRRRKCCRNCLCQHKCLCKLSQNAMTYKKRQYGTKKPETNSSQSRTSLLEDNDVPDNHLSIVDDNGRNQNTPMQPLEDKCSRNENYTSDHVAGYTEQLARSNDYKVQINIFHKVSCETENDLISCNNNNNHSELSKTRARVINNNLERKSTSKPKSNIVHFKTNTKQVRYNPVVQHDGGETYTRELNVEEKEYRVKTVLSKAYDKNKYSSDTSSDNEIESTSLANELQNIMLSVQSQHQKLYEVDGSKSSLCKYSEEMEDFKGPKILIGGIKENDEDIELSLKLKNMNYLDTVKKNEKIYNPLTYTTNDSMDRTEIKMAADLKEQQNEISQQKISHLLIGRELPTAMKNKLGKERGIYSLTQ